MKPQGEGFKRALTKTRGFRFLGLSLDDGIKYFFGGNAFFAVLVLALITVFLFREGLGFFAQSQRNLRVYRHAGLEYIDHIKRQINEHTALVRDLNALRLEQFLRMTRDGKSVEEINAALAPFDTFATQFSDTAIDLRGLNSDIKDTATAIKERAQVNEDRREEKEMLLKAGMEEKAAAVQIDAVDFEADRAAITGTLDVYREMNQKFAADLQATLASAPEMPTPAGKRGLDRAKNETDAFIATFPKIEENLKNWDATRPVTWWQPITAFLFGDEWQTASFWQDYYGLIPLLAGSVLISMIALTIAVPLGVCAAIYTSEIAGPREQKLIKPYIEFISAIPSVVLGFFGIAVLGGGIRDMSQWEILAWVPGFPISERLNAMTAGCLLALMAVPTIFTLSEDAINNVPRFFKEASYALGANRLQTIVRILIPASISGIISAILLGFGRVIGETMVVLLCAGNRIQIPDFSEGVSSLFQPVHTMTGIIAQEMGEVPFGSIHYRALFMIGVVLFLLALLINFIAQKIVQKFKISIG